MHTHQPIDITLRLPVPILHQQPRELILRAIQPLARNLQGQGLAAAQAGPVREEVAGLAVQMGVEQGQGGEEGVEGGEGGVGGAEEVFEQVGRDLGVQPEDAGLAVVDQVGAAVFDAGEGGAEAGRHEELAAVGGGEARFGRERVQRDDARVEQQREFERRGGFDEAHGVGAPVRRLRPGFEGPAFEQAEGVHAEFLEVLGQDELAGRMGAGEGFAVAGEDVDRLLREAAADLLQRALGHAGGG